MEVQYMSTFVRDGRNISEYKDSTETFESLLTKNCYFGVLADDLYRIIDVITMVSENSQENIDPNWVIGDFVATEITQQELDGYPAEHLVPIKQAGTDRFLRRLKFTDPFTDINLDVAYTSVNSPDRRNDLSFKTWSNDLVITAGDGRTFENTLVSVNGVMHRTIEHNGELFVVSGYENMVRMDAKSMAMLDTTELGGHTLYPITEDMIINTEEQSMRRGVYLKAPDGVSFVGKSVALMVHGRLLMFDNNYQVVGPNCVKVNTNKIDFEHFIMHHPLTRYSRPYRFAGDLTPTNDVPEEEGSISNAYDSENPLYNEVMDENGLIDLTKFRTDEFFINLMTSIHSGIIVFDNPNIFVRDYHLFATIYPGQFELWSKDTPRGVFMYNRQMVMPFTITSSTTEYQHTFYTSPMLFNDDLYQYDLNPTTVPAPWADTIGVVQRSPQAYLREIFTPDV